MSSVKSQDIELINRPVLHFYKNNELAEREIERILPFTITSKKIRYLLTRR